MFCITDLAALRSKYLLKKLAGAILEHDSAPSSVLLSDGKHGPLFAGLVRALLADRLA